MKKIKICVLNASLYALGDLIMLSSHINNLKATFLQKNIGVEFDFISRGSSKFLHNLIISPVKFYSLFNIKVNALTIFLRLFNFVYLFLLGGFLNLQKYQYFVSISSRQRKTAKIITKLYYKQIVYSFEEIYAAENLLLETASAYQNFNFIEAQTFEKPTIGFFIGASSTSKSWHPKNWAQLLLKVKNEFGDSILVHIYGSNKINQILYNIFEAECKILGLAEGIHYANFINKQNLIEDISHTKALSLAITNDSGFMWVCVACKIHNISILGFNNDTSYKQFDKNFFHPINSIIPCSPCFEGYLHCKNKTTQNNIEFYNCMGYNARQIDGVFDKFLTIFKKQ